MRSREADSERRRDGEFLRAESLCSRRCPRDGHALRPRDLGGVEVDVCLDCDGVFLDEGELDVLRGGSGEVFGSRSRTESSSFVGRVPHAYAAYRCPACRGDLLPRFYGRGRQRHELYHCSGCRGLWLDLRALRRLGLSMAPESFGEKSFRRALDAGNPGDQYAGTVDVSVAPPLPASAGGGSTIRVGFPRGVREWFVALTGFPIDVGNPCTIFPFVTWTLIVLNVAVFCAQIVSEPTEAGLALRYGLEPEAVRAGEWHRLLTSMFLHGGIFHLLGNIFFLYTFGDNLEERYRPLRYVLLYVGCGVVAGLLSAGLAWAEDENTIRIGASGAISGLLGAYLVSFPRTRILVGSLFLRFLPLVVRAPVWGFVVFWAGFNVIGWFVQREAGFYAVDYAAHLAGFVAGLLGGVVLAALYRGEAADPHVASRR